MIQSMTAYAQEAVEGPWGSLRWEIRSVNHRYSEFYFKLPEEVRELESSLREMARKKVGRGKLDCLLRFEARDMNLESLNINTKLAEQLVLACQKVAAGMHSPAPISPIEILSWPQVIESQEIDTSALKQGVQKGYIAAIDKLNEVRQTEGKELKQLIQTRLEGMEVQIEQIKAKFPEILAALKEKLHSKVAELDIQTDEGRFEQELVYLVHKSDIAEEVDRLGIHINEVKRVLEKGGLVGRRLDFLMQEMNREANTLASKSVDSFTSLAAVELKVLVEQVREQVQNLE